VKLQIHNEGGIVDEGGNVLERSHPPCGLGSVYIEERLRVLQIDRERMKMLLLSTARGWLGGWL
jgi:hypothetical protein